MSDLKLVLKLFYPFSKKKMLRSEEVTYEHWLFFKGYNLGVQYLMSESNCAMNFKDSSYKSNSILLRFQYNNKQ